MSDRDRDAIRELVEGWLDSAREDLITAHRLASDSDYPIYRIPAFHAQQAAEKTMKAILTHVQIDFPRTHDLERLKTQVPSDWERVQRLALEGLSRYAVDARYPDRMPEGVTAAEARDAVRQAGEVWEAAVADFAARGFNVEKPVVMGE